MTSESLTLPNLSAIVSEIQTIIAKYNITPERIVEAITWLTKYGYLVKNKSLTLQDVIDAIKQVEAFFNISNPQTGFPTPPILSLMRLPRCSHPDVLEFNQQNKWGLTTLNYFILKEVDALPHSDFEAAVAQAFQSWENVCGLTFNRTNDQNSAQIVISYGQGPKDQFDGPGGVLAWCQLPASPNFNGQVLLEMDDSESWIMSGSAGILVTNVLAHELGHAQGLFHTTVPGNLMNAFYSAAIATPQSDDIQKIQALYGPSLNRPQPSPTPEPVPQGNDLVLTISGDNLKFSLPGYRVLKM